MYQVNRMSRGTRQVDLYHQLSKKRSKRQFKKEFV